MSDIKEQVEAIRSLLKRIGKCEACGKSRLQMATRWKTSTTDEDGGTHDHATGFEVITPRKHCTCPGGPVWGEIQNSRFGLVCDMAHCYQLWISEGRSPDHVILRSRERGEYEHVYTADWIEIAEAVLREIRRNSL